MGNIPPVTDAEFETTVLKNANPVVVDFWAEWCGPCKAIAPILEDLSTTQDRFKIAKLNVDDAPATAREFQVMSIPTMILFKDGEPAAAAIGAQPKSALERSLGLEPVEA